MRRARQRVDQTLAMPSSSGSAATGRVRPRPAATPSQTPLVRARKPYRTRAPRQQVPFDDQVRLPRDRAKRLPTRYARLSRRSDHYPVVPLSRNRQRERPDCGLLRLFRRPVRVPIAPLHESVVLITGDPFAAWGSDVHVIAEAGPCACPCLGAKSPRGLSRWSVLGARCAAVHPHARLELERRSSSYRIGRGSELLLSLSRGRARGLGSVGSDQASTTKRGEHRAPHGPRIAIITILVSSSAECSLSRCGSRITSIGSWSSPQAQ